MTRLSQYFLPTLKENPKEAETPSHQLMLRSGLIQSHAAGIFSWLPLGVKVLKKLENIVRKHMDASGSLECELPVVQPAELWIESGRWQKYGPNLARLQDRHDRDFCLGPTHEEISVAIAKAHTSSYRDYPFSLYQIQTKFRDEIRPRHGIMRGREFIMKDAYSFHLQQSQLQDEFEKMNQTYSNILDELGLEWVAVKADSGDIGGDVSKEFQVVAKTGEDWIAIDEHGQAANIEVALSPAPQATSTEILPRQRIATPGVKTIDDLVKLGDTDTKFKDKVMVKSLLVETEKKEFVLVILLGDDYLNEIKLTHALGCGFEFAKGEMISSIMGANPGSLGPADVPSGVKILVDSWAKESYNFIAGSNEEGHHEVNLNWDRDIGQVEVADLRNVKDQDPTPTGGHYRLTKGIEVGHIFQLGSVYAKPMGLSVQDNKGQQVCPIMGCYGFGVTRAVAAAIEQHHDERGICWPKTLAPWQIHLVSMSDKEDVTALSTEIYQALVDLGVEVVIDDRSSRPGAKLADADLIGCPLRVVIGNHTIKKQQLEYKFRKDTDASFLAMEGNSSQDLAKALAELV